MPAFTSYVAAAAVGALLSSKNKAVKDAKAVADKQDKAQEDKKLEVETQLTQDREIADERREDNAALLKLHEDNMKTQQVENELARENERKLFEELTANNERLSSEERAASEAQYEEEKAEREEAARLSRVRVTEAQLLDSQDKGDKVAEVAIGTSSASDALLKEDPTKVTSSDSASFKGSTKKKKGRKIGGVSSKRKAVGGL